MWNENVNETIYSILCEIYVMREAQTEVLKFVVWEQGTHSSNFYGLKNNSGAHLIIGDRWYD